MLLEARLEDNPRFLSVPKLIDQDERGFCLLHHAAAFGNASKARAALRVFTFLLLCLGVPSLGKLRQHAVSPGMGSDPRGIPVLGILSAC